MANHKSAKKRNRQTIARTMRARSMRTRVRAVLKQARTAVEEGSDDAEALVKQVTSLLDRAGSKNAIPRKRTARLISRIHRAYAASKKQ